MLISKLLGMQHPIIQAPMAGVQDSALAIAVSNAGGLGSLPCAMLSVEDLRNQLDVLSSQTHGPFNVNFFCHTPPIPDYTKEQAWRNLLEPYYEEFGISVDEIKEEPLRRPFTAEAADILERYKPAVVSFHFGLPDPQLLSRVRGWGIKIISSATTLDEARWLASQGVDAIIAQGMEAGGHRGIFKSEDLTTQAGTISLTRQILKEINLPVIACGGIGDAVIPPKIRGAQK